MFIHVIIIFEYKGMLTKHAFVHLVMTTADDVITKFIDQARTHTDTYDRKSCTLKTPMLMHMRLWLDNQDITKYIFITTLARQVQRRISSGTHGNANRYLRSHTSTHAHVHTRTNTRIRYSVRLGNTAIGTNTECNPSEQTCRASIACTRYSGLPC